MSYGVVAWKVGNVRVERLHADGARSTPGPWAQGRLALTTLHLSFVPSHNDSGVDPMTLALSDIVAVEISSGRLHRVVSFRTAHVVVHTRVPGGAAFARRVEQSVAAAHKRLRGSSTRPETPQPQGPLVYPPDP